MLGKNHSNETKKKMSLSAMDNKSFSGHKHTDEWKEKMSKPRPHMRGRPSWNKGKKGLQKAWNKGIPNPKIRGENNPNWKGGISRVQDKIRNSLEYKEWRETVFLRDNNACVLCGIQGDINSPYLHADHIKSFAHHPELRTEVTNGRVLCRNCHCQTDSYAGRTRGFVY